MLILSVIKFTLKNKTNKKILVLISLKKNYGEFFLNISLINVYN